MGNRAVTHRSQSDTREAERNGAPAAAPRASAAEQPHVDREMREALEKVREIALVESGGAMPTDQELDDKLGSILDRFNASARK